MKVPSSYSPERRDRNSQGEELIVHQISLANSSPTLRWRSRPTGLPISLLIRSTNAELDDKAPGEVLEDAGAEASGYARLQLFASRPAIDVGESVTGNSECAAKCLAEALNDFVGLG